MSGVLNGYHFDKIRSRSHVINHMFLDASIRRLRRWIELNAPQSGLSLTKQDRFKFKQMGGHGGKRGVSACVKANLKRLTLQSLHSVSQQGAIRFNECAKTHLGEA